MAGRKTIFDRTGAPLTDIKSQVLRSSLLNDIGEAIFTIPTSSEKCKEEYLKWGNYLYIEHDSLPDWVGIIDTPRPWGNGVLEVHAFEVPSILKYRLAPLNYKINGTVGSKFLQLIGLANTQADTLISAVASVDGATGEETLTDTIYSHIKKMQENSKFDWTCVPVISAEGRLSIVMTLLALAGRSTDLEFRQGKNIQYGGNPLEESGEVINYVEAVGDKKEDSQVTTTYRDEESINKYGLRMARVAFSGITDLSTLVDNAKKYIDERKEAAMSTPLVAVFRGNTFTDIGLGNVAIINNTNVGFSGSGTGMSRNVRIEGYRFDEKSGTCELMFGKVRDV